ncbi:unnamed protein product [Victoria cruziana]
MKDYLTWATEERKQAAADALYMYSQFVMACIGEGVRPSKLRLHLMKEVSGIPTCLKKDPPQSTSQVKAGEPSSSGRMEGDKADSLSSNAL